MPKKTFLRQSRSWEKLRRIEVLLRQGKTVPMACREAEAASRDQFPGSRNTKVFTNAGRGRPARGGSRDCDPDPNGGRVGPVRGRHPNSLQKTLHLHTAALSSENLCMEAASNSLHAIGSGCLLDTNSRLPRNNQDLGRAGEPAPHGVRGVVQCEFRGTLERRMKVQRSIPELQVVSSFIYLLCWSGIISLLL